MQVRDMTEGRPVKLIFAVALPLMLGNVFQQLYTVMDAQIVGMVEGVSALAALGASDWYNWLFLGIIQGFAQGFAIPMAQAFGAKDHALLRRTIGGAVVLAAGLAMAVMALALASLQPVLHLLGTPESIQPTSRRYLILLFSGYPVTMAYNLMAGILRSLGDGRSPLWAMVTASLTNIALDLLFVAVFHWGVAGAAVATVIAQLVSCLFCLRRLARIDFIRPSRSDLRPGRAMNAHLMRLGLPIAAQNGVIGVGGMIVQRIVNTMGVTFIAGYTATNKLYGVLEIAAISYGYAVSTYCGQNMGARKARRIQSGVHAAALTGVLTACVITVCMFLFGRSIVGSFLSGEPEEVAAATNVAVEFLRLMSGWLPVLYLLHIYRSALQGMGNTVRPMASGLAEFAMRMAAALLLPQLIGYSGVFWAEILAWIGADLILIPSYYKTYRRFRKRFPGGAVQGSTTPLS